MNKYTMISLPVALGCFLGSCAIACLATAIIVADALIPGLALPNSYFQALNFPILSVLLPVVGMVVLAPTALYLAFKREAPAVQIQAVEAERAAEVKELRPEESFLKAA